MILKSNPTQEAKPFLRWAGGKNWLIKHLKTHLTKFTFNNYHEMFLGGASVFLFVNPKQRSFLSDLNSELIETYEVVRDNVSRLVSEMEDFRNNEKFYYSVRETIPSSKIKRAARFIYLNQTSFNGIYRVNLKGVYNVPYGFRSKDFLEEQNLRTVSGRLQEATLNACSFDEAVDRVRKGDFVFLDPPYTVSHNNNGFIKYNQNLFSLDDQYKLAACIEKIKRKGASYLLTNAAHKKIDEIFGTIDKKMEVRRASLIGGSKAERGHVSEYLFTNISALKKIQSNIL